MNTEQRLQKMIEERAESVADNIPGGAHDGTSDAAYDAYKAGASLLAPLLVKLEGAVKAQLEDCEHPYACSCAAKAEESAKKALSSFEKFLEGGGE